MFAASKSGSAAEPTDAQFNYVTMLLHGDGTNGAQNNTFLDSSTNNFTITRNGNTTQGTFTPYGSNWSNYFDGSGDYLQAGTSANLALGSGDFTIEGWFFCTGYNGGAALYSTINTYPSSNGLLFYIDTNGKYTIDVNGTILQPSGAATLNAWVHYAVVRSSTTITIYINGSSIGTVSSSTNYSDQYAVIGRTGAGSASNYFLGYISNTRMVKGTAVYTSTFTPPTSPLTAITNTQFLTCQSNRFIDNSTNAFTITKNGDTSVQRFSPFSPTTAYSTSVIGGSGYFDGSGDYLSVANNSAFNLNGVSFTVECWVYWNSVSGEQNIAEQFTGPSGPGWTLYKFASGSGSPSGSIDFYGGSGSINSGVTPVAGQWYHLAISRNNSTGTTSFYVNGTRTATATFGVASSASTALLVGVRNGGSTWLNGYMEDLRVVKGSYIYDPTATTITIPNAPLTAVTSTQLLLNYTNAAILDNAMMNDLETVGNAQISTSVKKYGTGSMYFDGTGDYLTALTNPNLVLGSGDFTVECWIYTGTTGSRSGIIGNRTSSGGDAVWCIDLNPTNVGGFGYMYLHTDNSQIVSSSTNYSANTWFHLAVTRSGTTFRMFLDGTQVGSSTSSVNFSSTATMYIGAEGSRTDQSSPLNGYIDDLRITKGVARYTTTFTPPTAAFADKG